MEDPTKAQQQVLSTDTQTHSDSPWVTAFL